MLGSERESYTQLLEFTPRNRLAVERAIEGLVDLLDAFDAPDADREPDPDDEDDGTGEPILGAPERHPDPPDHGYATAWGPYTDRSSAARQTGWAAGDREDREIEDEHDEDGHDREDEHDGREPDVDGEEEVLDDDRDSGIADQEGYHEQCSVSLAGHLPGSIRGYVA